MPDERSKGEGTSWEGEDFSTCSHRAAVVGVPRCRCCAGSSWEKGLVASLPRGLRCTAQVWIWAAQDLGEAGFDGNVKVPGCAELHTTTADHYTARQGGYLYAGVQLFVETQCYETLSSCLQEG